MKRTENLMDAPREPEAGVRYKMDGRALLAAIPAGSASAAFFDPQYRGILDKMRYGNEGVSRGRERCELPQMTPEVIRSFMEGISAALAPSGHLFLWMDKFHVCEGAQDWADGLPLDVVDMVVWDKERIGMGYRTRRRSEYLLVMQKQPKRAKGVWVDHSIPDVWRESVNGKTHTHVKPVGLQRALIEAVTRPGDLVVDPAAGSFSVMEACGESRRFIGCDIEEGVVEWRG